MNKYTVLELFKQSIGARNRVGIGLSYRPARLHAGGIDSLEYIPGLLKSLKIWALYTRTCILHVQCVRGGSMGSKEGRGPQTNKTPVAKSLYR